MVPVTAGGMTVGLMNLANAGLAIATIVATPLDARVAGLSGAPRMAGGTGAALGVVMNGGTPEAVGINRTTVVLVAAKDDATKVSAGHGTVRTVGMRGGLAVGDRGDTEIAKDARVRMTVQIVVSPVAMPAVDSSAESLGVVGIGMIVMHAVAMIVEDPVADSSAEMTAVIVMIAAMGSAPRVIGSSDGLVQVSTTRTAAGPGVFSDAMPAELPDVIPAATMIAGVPATVSSGAVVLVIGLSGAVIPGIDSSVVEQASVLIDGNPLIDSSGVSPAVAETGMSVEWEIGTIDGLMEQVVVTAALLAPVASALATARVAGRTVRALGVAMAAVAVPTVVDLSDVPLTAVATGNGPAAGSLGRIGTQESGGTTAYGSNGMTGDRSCPTRLCRSSSSLI